MATLPTALYVFGPEGLVGTLFPTEPLRFAYAAAWIDARGVPLHASIPLAAGIVNTVCRRIFREPASVNAYPETGHPAPRQPDFCLVGQ